MVDTPGPAVETIGLHKKFGNVVAVDGLDLRAQVGSSGSLEDLLLDLFGVTNRNPLRSTR